MFTACQNVVLLLLSNVITFTKGTDRENIKMSKTKGYVHSMSPEQYNVILKLVKKTFNKPVRERSTLENSAITKYYRRKESFSLGKDGLLLFEGKKVVRKDEVSKYVASTFHKIKSGGVKKLRGRAANSLAGLSEKRIFKITDK